MCANLTSSLPYHNLQDYLVHNTLGPFHKGCMQYACYKHFHSTKQTKTTLKHVNATKVTCISPSSEVIVDLRVNTVFILFPKVLPFHLKSQVLVRENLWLRCRLLSLSSLCWCLFSARVLVVY